MVPGSGPSAPVLRFWGSEQPQARGREGTDGAGSLLLAGAAAAGFRVLEESGVAGPGAAVLLRVSVEAEVT